MKRFTWWRMEQNPPHNAGERWCASCSILHHVKRFMSHSPKLSKNILSLPLFGLVLDIIKFSFILQLRVLSKKNEKSNLRKRVSLFYVRMCGQTIYDHFG